MHVKEAEGLFPANWGASKMLWYHFSQKNTSKIPTQWLLQDQCTMLLLLQFISINSNYLYSICHNQKCTQTLQRASSNKQWLWEKPGNKKQPLAGPGCHKTRHFRPQQFQKKITDGDCEELLRVQEELLRVQEELNINTLMKLNALVFLVKPVLFLGDLRTSQSPQTNPRRKNTVILYWAVWTGKSFTHYRPHNRYINGSNISYIFVSWQSFHIKTHQNNCATEND